MVSSAAIKQGPSANRKHPNFFLGLMQISKIVDIFPKKPFEKCTLCEYFEIVSGWVL